MISRKTFCTVSRKTLTHFVGAPAVALSALPLGCTVALSAMESTASCSKWKMAELEVTLPLTDEEVRQRSFSSDFAGLMARKSMRGSNTESVLGLTVEQMHEPSVVLQVVRADCLASFAHAVIRQGIVTLQHLDAEEQVELPVCDLDDVPLSDGRALSVRCICTYDAQCLTFELLLFCRHNDCSRVIRRGGDFATHYFDALHMSKTGSCRYDIVVELKDEDILARDIVRSPAGSLRRRVTIENAINTMECMGITKAEMEEPHEGEGMSPGFLRVTAVGKANNMAKGIAHARALMLEFFGEPPDPLAAPRTTHIQSEMLFDLPDKKDCMLILQTIVSFDYEKRAIVFAVLSLPPPPRSVCPQLTHRFPVVRAPHGLAEGGAQAAAAGRDCFERGESR